MICVKCEKVIAATVKDPVYSATSLGPGYFHERCAKLVWSAKERAKEERANRTRAARAKHAKKVFHGARDEREEEVVFE